MLEAPQRWKKPSTFSKRWVIFSRWESFSVNGRPPHQPMAKPVWSPRTAPTVLTMTTGQYSRSPLAMSEPANNSRKLVGRGTPTAAT